MITNTLDFSKSVLAAMRYSVDDQGLISTMGPTGKPQPATIDGRRLVLPTPEWLRRGFGEDYVAFHPLSESLSRKGTSPVLQHMQRNARAVLAHYFIYLSQQLLAVAADPGLHKDLPTEAKDYLIKVADADKKLVQAFDKLVMAAVKKNRLITVYLKNGGTYDGKKVNRLAVIRFPLLELLDGEDNNVLGVELRPKQRKTLSNLLRFIVPFGDSPEEYSAGSNNRVAPYLHAFLHAYLKIGKQFNRIIHRYAKPMALPIKELPLYSEETLSKMSEWVDEIPSQRFNEGGVDETDEEGNAPPPSAPAVTQPTQPATTAVTVTNQPAPTPSKGEGVSVRDFLNSIRPQQPQQPVVVNQPQVGGYAAMMGLPAPVDPRMPSWLVGNQAQVQTAQAVSPFAHAVAGVQTVQVAQPVVTGYGGITPVNPLL